MAMGKRSRHAKRASMWVATQDLQRSPAHPFYARLNQIFEQHGFDARLPSILRTVSDGLARTHHGQSGCPSRQGMHSRHANSRGCHPSLTAAGIQAALAYAADLAQERVLPFPA